MHCLHISLVIKLLAAFLRGRPTTAYSLFADSIYIPPPKGGWTVGLHTALALASGTLDSTPRQWVPQQWLGLVVSDFGLLGYVMGSGHLCFIANTWCIARILAIAGHADQTRDNIMRYDQVRQLSCSQHFESKFGCEITEYRIQARMRASGSRGLVQMICLVFLFEFGFVTGLHGTLLLVLLVRFTPYDFSRQRGIHIPRLNPFVNSGEMLVGGCACMCLMLVQAWLFTCHRVLHCSKLYC